MPDFEAEMYLRLLGEREVAAVDETRRFSRRADMLEAAAALVSCGCLPAAIAAPVVEDYAAAIRLRHRQGLAPSTHRVRPAQPVKAPVPLAPRRVFPSGTEFESRQLGRVHVRWVLVNDTRIILNVSVGPSPGRARTAVSPSVEITTSDGQLTRASLEGGPQLGFLDAPLTPPADADPAGDWLCVDGTPIRLGPRAREVEVTVRPSKVANPAVAYLWQMLADFSDIRGQEPGVEAALTALTTAGLISATDAALGAIAWVKNRAAPVERVGQMHGRAAPPSVRPPATTPVEWRGLAGGRTGAFSGPERTLGIGAVTPVFDGVCVAIEAIRSRTHSLWLDIEIAGVPLSCRGYGQLLRNPLAFWARDDRDNFYLGHVDEWTGDPDGRSPARASIEFAALDPAAGELTVIATTIRARALIRMTL